MNIICFVFGHSMWFDREILGSSTCKRCGHKESAVKFNIPPMPVCKNPKLPPKSP